MSDTKHYKCIACGAMDSDSSPHPVVGPLNCWKCKSGFQKGSTEEMRRQGVGMYRTDDVIWLIEDGARQGKELS